MEAAFLPVGSVRRLSSSKPGRDLRDLLVAAGKVQLSNFSLGGNFSTEAPVEFRSDCRPTRANRDITGERSSAS
jgi:hypothetical protein